MSLVYHWIKECSLLTKAYTTLHAAKCGQCSYNYNMTKYF